MYLPGMDDGCLEIFLDGLSKRYPDHHLLIVLDGAPSHRSEQIERPANMSFLRLPRYSPELDPAEDGQEFRRKLSNKRFQSVALIEDALTKTLGPSGRLLPSSSGSPATMVGKGGGGYAMTSIDRNVLGRDRGK